MTERKLYQIASWGGTTKWIDLAFESFPNTKGLLLLVNKNPRDKENEEYVKKAKEAIGEWRKRETEKPMPKRRIYEALVIDSEHIKEFYSLVYVFRSLFAQMDEEGYDLILNLTNGLKSWIMALYIASLDSNNIKTIFSFNKKTGDIDVFWRHRPITDIERAILNILKDCEQCTVSDIQKKYFSKYGKGNLSFTSKVIKKLSNTELISVIRRGKVVYVSITDIGRAYSETLPITAMGHVYKLGEIE